MAKKFIFNIVRCVFLNDGLVLLSTSPILSVNPSVIDLR